MHGILLKRWSVRARIQTSGAECETVGIKVVGVTSIRVAISIVIGAVALVRSALAISSSKVVVREHVLLVLVVPTLLGCLVAVVIANTLCNKVLRHASSVGAALRLERLLATTGVGVTLREE